MKKYILALFTLFLLLTIMPMWSSAHSGRTDSNGGHYDQSTGEYHYHHGYSAHKHTDGKCPYEYEDRTTNSSSNTNENSYTSSKHIFSWKVFLITSIINTLILVLLKTNVISSKKTPEWLSTTLALFFFTLPIADFICILCNFWGAVSSDIAIFGIWFCIRKYRQYRKENIKRKSDNHDEDI